MIKNQLFKTKLCKAFEETGTCSRGDSCNFAHGNDELREAPEGGSQFQKNDNSGGGWRNDGNKGGSDFKQGFQQQRKPTVQCRGWKEGNCSFGNKCRFLHGEPNQKICRSYNQGGCTYENCKFAHIAYPQSSSNGGNGGSNLKTKPCNNFSQTGTCKYGENCKFAHSN